MHLDRALAAIDHARTQEDVLSVLRDFARAAAGSSGWVSEEIEDADDVAAIAVELARVRAATMSTDLGLIAAETLFARACVKMAALLDVTGAWVAYTARANVRGSLGRDEA